ncbi:hypothetical protein ACLKA7_001464 [Drosophila subpalustris]
MEASKQQNKSRIELFDNEERVKLIEEVQQRAIVFDLTDKKQKSKARHGTSVEGDRLQLQAISDQDRSLNETSHSIAAVRAALIDAKCKFFGINKYDALDAAVPSLEKTSSPIQIQGIKPEHKYQNVPQTIRVPILSESGDLQPMKTTTILSPDRSLRCGATYEQIPLRDFDEQQPSQAVYMSTTVPQNMKGIKIAGRHTPTRNSLRHSRMIVVNNKSQHSVQETYSTDHRNLYFPCQLLILQLIIGLLIAGLALWILILIPNASILINPYLSGLSLLLVSVAGLILLGRYRRIEFHTSNNNCHKALLAKLYVFSALALICCCLSLVSMAIEITELRSAITSNGGECGPATISILSYHNCSCWMENQHVELSEGGLNDEVNEDINSIKSCKAIREEWKYLLGFSMALNTAGICATFFYIAIFICCLRSNPKHFNTSIKIVPKCINTLVSTNDENNH